MIIINASILAAKLHQQWAENFRLEGGTTRIKSTTDASWISANGTDQVDIANTEFEALPSDWQDENYQSALVAKQLLETLTTIPDLTHEATRLSLGAVIHDAWLARNTWAKETPLGETFENLSRQEQDKDIAVIATAITLI